MGPIAKALTYLIESAIFFGVTSRSSYMQVGVNFLRPAAGSVVPRD